MVHLFLILINIYIRLEFLVAFIEDFTPLTINGCEKITGFELIVYDQGGIQMVFTFYSGKHEKMSVVLNL